MRHSLKEITILRGLFNDRIFSRFAEYAEGNSSELSEFLYEFYNRKNFSETELNFMAYVENLIISDDNVVTRMLAGGRQPGQVLENILLMDIETVFSIIEETDSLGRYSCEHEKFNDAYEALAYIKAVCPEYGYGDFIRYHAFTFQSGRLEPAAEYNNSKLQPTLDKLKDYRIEKRLIENNLVNFIKGYPCCNMLLYGDRGTGKSSTVHAMVREHFKDGLRLIEINNSQLSEIPAVRKLVGGNPLKFVILIDDLSIGESESLSSLKACLEGTAAISENTIVVATSNRRHIVKESFSDRTDAVHANDVMQEQLSLSDRFGLTVMFSSTGKAEYLSIVKQLAADEGLTLPEDELCDIAERWALTKGGRSPRRARQFIDLAVAAQARKVKIEF